MSDTLLLAAAAVGASEATGTTNFTPIGADGDDENDDPPNSVARGIAPGLIGALRSATGGSGGPQLDLDLGGGRYQPGGGSSGGGSVIDELVARLDETTDAGNTSGTVKDNADRAGELIDQITDGTVPVPSGGNGGGDGGDSFGPLDAFEAVNNFDAAEAGTAFGEGASDFGTNATDGIVSGIGESIGQVPFALVDGATDAGGAAGNRTRRWIADVTGAEGDGEGVNADRPGAGITDVLDMAASGEQGGVDPEDTQTPGEAVASIADAAGDRLSGGLTGDPDTSIFGGGSGSSGSGSSGPIDAGGSSDPPTLMEQAPDLSPTGDSGSSGSSGSGSSGGTSSAVEATIGSEDPEDEDDDAQPWRGSGSARNAGLIR